MTVTLTKTYTVPDGRRGDVIFALWDDDAIRIERSGEFVGYVSVECIDDMIDALSSIKTDVEEE